MKYSRPDIGENTLAYKGRSFWYINVPCWTDIWVQWYSGSREVVARTLGWLLQSYTL